MIQLSLGRLALLTGVVIALGIGVTPLGTRVLTYVHEIAVLYIKPTAEEVYALGNVHFDAMHGALYDLDRAEELYTIALKLDPATPFARHQLARIEFLNGNLDSARKLIDEEITLAGTHASPSSYYIRALIRGYAGDYIGSAADYREYLRTDATNWAATNDLAWVLLKDGRYEETLEVIDPVLALWPTNPWLLNSKSIALYELGRLPEALVAAETATVHAQELTESIWMLSYPGNDPLSAASGVDFFKKSVMDNRDRIRLVLEEGQSAIQAL